MKDHIKSHFSYARKILRFSQALMVIGTLIQIVRLMNSSQFGELSYVVQVVLSILIYVILFVLTIIAEKKVFVFIKSEVEGQVEQITTVKNSMFAASQLPVVMIHESGKIKWCNTAFIMMMDGEEELLDKNIKELFTDMKPGEFTEAKVVENRTIKVKEKLYSMSVEKFVLPDQEEPMYVLYFIDKTENESLKIQIKEERCMMGYLCIDNIDEISHSIEEVRRPMLLAIIDRKINLWFKEREVVIAKLDRDKYILVFNKKELAKMEQTKFDILDEVRQIQVGNELPVTVSLGIGHNLNSLLLSKEDARIAFDLAQGRGGDQAVIKHNDKYTFYGGKTKEVEKSARVKVRIKAYAFKELLHEADKVYIMGHKGSDMDSLGAAMGVYRAASIMGKKAHIVLNEPTFAIKALYDRIMESNEYEDLFITHEEAQKEIRKDTLLVVVDVHRRSFVECPELLEKAEKVVVFDHHRRSTDFIEDAVLTYLEPFISSTCEMVSEILNYLTDKIKLTSIEADALLAGITMDTKNFMVKAGVRTFEAAAFLRRSGADSTRVRMLFQNDIDTYKVKAKAIQTAEMWQKNMIVTDINGNVPNASVLAAQVADELLNIKGIETSFVLTVLDDQVTISARALGDINVQRIMELLGGGGHLGIAGAQLKDVNLYEARRQLREAINKYFEEGETK